MAAHVHLCFTTTGLEDLPQHQQRDLKRVARHLAKHGRFSVFEATCNQVIARTMDKLSTSGWFTFDHSVGYPWTRCALTEKGKKELGYE